MNRLVLGIDIGLYHMGIVQVEISEEWGFIGVKYCELVDITKFKCNEKDCELFHESCMADYMSHFFKNYSNLLNKSDYIVIERQPPMGLISIQEFIRYKYRNKSILVSPNSMHCHYTMNDLNYEQRKIRVVKMTEGVLSKFENFKKVVRKHDISDALCIVKYFLFNKHNEYMEQKRLEEWKKQNHKFITNLKQFIYNPTFN